MMLIGPDQLFNILFQGFQCLFDPSGPFFKGIHSSGKGETDTIIISECGTTYAYYVGSVEQVHSHIVSTIDGGCPVGFTKEVRHVGEGIKGTGRLTDTDTREC